MSRKFIDSDSWKPLKIDIGERHTFKAGNSEVIVIDEGERDLEELFLLRNPKYKFDSNYKEEFEKFYKKYKDDNFGEWFFFPWLNALVRYFPEDLHNELRTGRNKNLITGEEQARFYYSTIAYLGLSVGSHIAIVNAITGGARRVKLADPDTLSGDNLNRIRAGFQNTGLSKATIVARQIYEINPYSEVEIFPEGLTDNNVEKILNDVDVVIEEMDNPYWKLKVRELAREQCIPVLMGTDNGDGAIVDVERFDLNKKYPILHGKIGKLTADGLKSMSTKDLPRVAGQIAGANLATPRMLYSVAEVGKSLYSWPQLGTAANLCGSVISMLTRRIVNNDATIKSGRYVVNPDSIFESGYSRKWLQRKIAFFQFIREMMKRQ